MLNVEISSKAKEIQAHQKDIDIVFDDEDTCQFAFELPSAGELRVGRCKPVPKVSVTEITTQDPFNFRDLFHQEFVSMSHKQTRFRDSKSFALKFAGVASLSGELDEAERVLSEWSAKHKDQRVLQKLGDTFIQKGRPDKALELFQSNNLHLNVYSNLRIAFIHATNNDLKSATKYLEVAQSIDPSDYRTQMFLGAINLNLGQCEKAIRNFRTASITKKDSSALHVNLAASHLSLGHTEKAVRELQKAITINPLNENALVFYSDLLADTKQFVNGIPSLELFVRINQSSHYVWERLARAYYFTGNFTKAKKALEAQISLREDSAALNNLGLVYWQLQNRGVALQYLYESIELALKDEQRFSLPLLNMVTILNESKKYKETCSILKELINSDSTTIEDRILSKLAIEYFVALEGLEEYDLAVDELRKYLARPNTDAEGRMLLLTCKIYSDIEITKDVDGCHKSTKELLDLLNKHEKTVSSDSTRVAYNNIVDRKSVV